jgi:hypothetical protein
VVEEGYAYMHRMLKQIKKLVAVAVVVAVAVAVAVAVDHYYLIYFFLMV